MAQQKNQWVKKIRSLTELDQLPDSALITDLEARSIYGDISRTTHWRGVKDGLYPAPIKIGPKMNRYNLGKARACARGEDWR